MSSNEAKMTLEEKLVQRIKSDSLLSLVGDEDALVELTRRAVNEALYQPARVRREYGPVAEQDSPVVAASRSVAAKALALVADEILTALREDPKTMAAIREAMAAMVPAVLKERVQGWVGHMEEAGSQKAMENVQSMIRDGQAP